MIPAIIWIITSIYILLKRVQYNFSTAERGTQRISVMKIEKSAKSLYMHTKGREKRKENLFTL